MGHVRKRRGKPGWYGRFKDVDGRWREVRLPGTRAEATRALLVREMAVWNARFGVAEQAPVLEVSTLREAWQAHVETHCRPRTWEGYEIGLREVLPWVAARALRERRRVRLVGDLRLDDVRAYAAAKLAQGASPRTVNMRVVAVTAMVRWGLGEGLIAQNPLARWRPLPLGPPRRERRALT